MQSILFLILAALWLAWSVLSGRVGRPADRVRASACESFDASKIAAVMFEPNSTALNPLQMPGIKMVADDIKSRLHAGATGVELRAYGGSVGDRALDISRKRGLALRNALVSDGVSGDRIELRPMGRAVDCGSPDRVDLFLRKN